MSAVVALRCPLDEDLSDLVALLRQSGVPHRVTEEAGEQVVWVPDQRFAELVQSWHQQIPLTVEAEPAAPRRRSGSALQDFLKGLLRQPVTSAMLLLTLVFALITGLGENLSTVSWLTMTALYQDGQDLYAYYLPHTFATGQWWRLVSPMFLHFGLLHLAMNSLWYWELGRRIEWCQRGWMLLLLTLLFALASNFAQILFTGPGRFGGLSGVIYGLLGHCWLFNRLAPTPLYHLNGGIVAMMIGWLLLCMTGFTEVVGLGAIANAAHIGGLLTGVLTGVIGGLLARRR